MSDILVLIITIIFVLYFLYKVYSPNIEIVQIEVNKYKVLLWYSVYSREGTKRAFIKLFNFKL